MKSITAPRSAATPSGTWAANQAGSGCFAPRSRPRTPGTIHRLTVVPKAIGVGYGGPVNWRTGRIVKSYHLSRWNDFPLAEWLHDLSGLPVFVENDANVEALGEALGGAGRGCEPWREAVARHLRHCVMDAFQPGPRVALPALRGDAVPVGALALAV